MAETQPEEAGRVEIETTQSEAIPPAQPSPPVEPPKLVEVPNDDEPASHKKERESPKKPV